MSKPTPEEIAAADETARQLLQEMAAIPEAERRPLTGRFFGPFAETLVDDEAPEPGKTKQ